MAAASTSATITEPVLHGIDRMVRNVETGRFERSLSALTAVGARGHGGGDLLRARLAPASATR